MSIRSPVVLGFVYVALLAGAAFFVSQREAPAWAQPDPAPALGAPGPGAVRFVLAAGGQDAAVLSLAGIGEPLSPCILTDGDDANRPVWLCDGGPFILVALHRAGGDSVRAVLDAPSAEHAARFAGAAKRLLVRRAARPATPAP